MEESSGNRVEQIKFGTISVWFYAYGPVAAVWHVTSKGTFNKYQAGLQNTKFEMLHEMQNNEMVESLFHIPSLDSESARFMIVVLIIARSESTPTSLDLCRPATPLNLFSDGQVCLFKPCPSSQNFTYNDVRSCCDDSVEAVEQIPARVVSKRVHNFLVGLELHQDSVNTKACTYDPAQAAAACSSSTSFNQLPSAVLWPCERRCCNEVTLKSCFKTTP